MCSRTTGSVPESGSFRDFMYIFYRDEKFLGRADEGVVKRESFEGTGEGLPMQECFVGTPVLFVELVRCSSIFGPFGTLLYPTVKHVFIDSPLEMLQGPHRELLKLYKEVTARLPLDSHIKWVKQDGSLFCSTPLDDVGMNFILR